MSVAPTYRVSRVFSQHTCQARANARPRLHCSAGHMDFHRAHCRHHFGLSPILEATHLALTFGYIERIRPVANGAWRRCPDTVWCRRSCNWREEEKAFKHYSAATRYWGTQQFSLQLRAAVEPIERLVRDEQFGPACNEERVCGGSGELYGRCDTKMMVGYF